MRYRLFGKDGVNNEKEFKLLVSKGIIKELEYMPIVIDEVAE